MKIEILILLIVVSCSTKNPVSNDNLTKAELSPTNTEINQNLQIDSLLFDAVKINDSIPLKLKESELLNKLGQPDSIIMEYNWDCGNYLDESDSVNVYYYGSTRFIVSRGEALLHKFYPDNNLTFGTTDFKIKSETRESEIKLLFPKSYNNMLYRVENEKYFDKRRLKVGMIKNPISPDDNGFIFYFENEKLIRVELWWFIC